MSTISPSFAPDVAVDLAESHLSNADLAPVPMERAISALLVSVLPNIPGFLVTIKVLPETSVAPTLVSLYRYAWFVGFTLAFVLYLLLRKLTPRH